MTIQQAVDWCNAHVGQAMDFDGQYGAQCVDFFNFYYSFITGRSPYADGYGVPGAKDLWNVATDLFDKITNDPNDPNQLPPQGSILIYDGGLSGSDGAGHVAVVDSANAQQVTVWDQNWGGMYVHHQAHMWTGHEIGWLVYKNWEAPIPMITLDQLTQLYQDLLGRAPDPAGISHYVGNYTYDFVKNDILNSAEYATKADQAVAQSPAPAPEQPVVPAAPSATAPDAVDPTSTGPTEIPAPAPSTPATIINDPLPPVNTYAPTPPEARPPSPPKPSIWSRFWAFVRLIVVGRSK